jgi:phosphotransferase system IIA component
MAKNGDAVSRRATPLIEVRSREAVAAAGYNTITPLIVCNSDEYTAVEAAADKTVAQGETVLTLKK